MTTHPGVDLARIAKHLGCAQKQVRSVVELLDEGNTIPFITRYRKDQTGGLDEEQIRQVEGQLVQDRMLHERKQTILRSIEAQGKLSEALAARIEAADSTKRLEDLYLPFKPKKQTKATLARQRGLDRFADEILRDVPEANDLEARAAAFVNPDREVANKAEALAGAGHVLAEQFSELADVRQTVRKIFRRTATLVSTRTKANEQQATGFRDYFDFRAAVAKLPPHRVLAINRGERSKVLRVRVESDLDTALTAAEKIAFDSAHRHHEFLLGCLRDALTRLVLPYLERELRRELTDRSERHAIDVFARNLRNLLLQPPTRNRRVLAIDPGYKSGCKLVALDEFGNLLAHDVIYLVGSETRKAQAADVVVGLIDQHQLSAVAIGNGSACRETEEWLSDLLGGRLQGRGISYVVVNEAGASVYSASPLGREELPDHDATVRGAVSIGRRLQDPLSELVKIDPASIGVGLYQHDLKSKELQSSLDTVVESCVNYVGVDVNSASPALLRYVSGLNQLTARRVYDYRSANGPFTSRQQLTEVPGFGEAAFVQAAGFLKITDGTNPLDSTWIHPESYHVAQQVLSRLQCQVSDLGDRESAQRLAAEIEQIDPEPLAQELSVGQMLVRDLLAGLARPGRDPREDLPAPVFREGVVKLEDLEVGMELSGTVLNVVDFGVFVDIGLSDSGLVHISQLANRYVRDPHEVAAVSDTVKVWVRAVDKERRRVSLTMIPPGVESTDSERRVVENRKTSRTHRDPVQKTKRPRPPKAKRKPSPPITEAMQQGQEPMRTFGDLKQFYDKRQNRGR